MALKVFNTLSNRLEGLQPLEDRRIRMYSCGPTVYDYGHIGNFRTFVFVDLFRRFLRQSGYRLDHVMNITDVDDKIIRNAAQKGLGVREYAEVYERAFFEDMRMLSLEKPERIARATEHMAGDDGDASSNGCGSAQEFAARERLRFVVLDFHTEEINSN